MILFVLSIITFPLEAKEKVTIAAFKTVELSYEEFSSSDVELNNKSGKAINVSVIDPETNKQVKGFGLGPMGKVVLSVPANHVLKLTNNSMKEVKLLINFVEKEEKNAVKESTEYVNFTLHNASLKSIPLIIPSVMNPNLSPLSNSGVRLKIGQEIYYKKGGKKKLLLIVDDKIQQGDKLNVAQIIKELEKDS